MTGQDTSASDALREPPAPRAVVLDVGEVLVDESRVHAVWAELLGVSPLTLGAVMGAAIVQGEASEVAFDHVAPNVDWRALEAEHQQRYGGFRDADLYADVRPCLDELTRQGFTVVIAGNQPARRHAELEALGLSYDRLATSDELGVAKPDPAYFDAVLALAGVADPSEALHVGDRVDNDVLPAAAAGWATCWLRRGPWGQLQDLPEGVVPDLVLEGLGELPVLLSAWRGGGADDEEAG